jgi:DNA-binding transcriptional LysR family regulator
MKFEIGGLSIERLLTFCAVVEFGSIKTAARGDPTRQSQYSRQIKELEESLGVKLFDRNGKHLTLNESGRRVALLAQSFLEELQQVRAADGAIVVTIGAAESVLSCVVFPKLEELGRYCPQVRFEFRNMRTDDVISHVRDGSLHFGIVRENANSEGLDSHFVAEMKYTLVVPRIILPQGRAEDIFLLRTLPIGILSSDGRLRQSIDDLARAEGFVLNVKLVADSFTLLMDAAPKARCAVILPDAMARKLPEAEYAAITPNEFVKLTRKVCVISNPRVLIMRSALRKVADSFHRIFG